MKTLLIVGALASGTGTLGFIIGVRVAADHNSEMMKNLCETEKSQQRTQCEIDVGMARAEERNRYMKEDAICLGNHRECSSYLIHKAAMRKELAGAGK